MLRTLVLTLCLWLTASFAHARQSLPVDTGNTEIMLISDHDTVAPGQSFTVALKMKFDGNWYTYWRNAGDSGEPVNIAWDLPPGVSAGPFTWPAPKTKTVGPIVSYAMDREVWLPVEITLDETVDPNTPITLKGHAYYLVCDDYCVPEDGRLSLPMGLGEAKIKSADTAQIETAKTKIPRPAKAKGSATLENGKVVFEITGLPKGFQSPALFPNENPIIVHSDPVDLATAEQGLQFKATPSYGWDDGTPESFEATFVAADGRAIIVPIATNSRVNIGAIKAGSGAGLGPGAKISLWGAIIGAFLGGLILNLMPCVFPIISLKALSIAKTAHGERQEIRRSAWAYTIGVLASFVLIALVVIAVKMGGASVGWGVQLQSPWVVALVSLLLFAIGLNLLGVFEVGGRIQNYGANRAQGSRRMASFMTGVLAVIVATPCGAPFMGTAVGFALVNGTAIDTLLIMIALGLGFALPFLLIAYFPNLLSRLPKPGAWMETFKQFLAFPMFGAAILFVWVLVQQSGAPGLATLLGAALALSFAIWALQKNGVLAKAIGGIALILALILPLTVNPPSVDEAQTLTSNAWSAQAVAAARAENRPVLVDFTAAWCVTCKVNEGLVLNRQKTARLFERTNTEFLVADWTNKDDRIAAELQRFGRAGVPLYLVYKPGATEAEILPQTLSYRILKDALED